MELSLQNVVLIHTPITCRTLQLCSANAVGPLARAPARARARARMLRIS